MQRLERISGSRNLCFAQFESLREASRHLPDLSERFSGMRKPPIRAGWLAGRPIDDWLVSSPDRVVFGCCARELASGCVNEARIWTPYSPAPALFKPKVSLASSFGRSPILCWPAYRRSAYLLIFTPAFW